MWVFTEKRYGCSFCDKPWDWNSPFGVVSIGAVRTQTAVWQCENGHIEATYEVEKAGKKKVRKVKFKYLHPHAVSELIWAPDRFFKNVNKWRRWKGPKVQKEG